MQNDTNIFIQEYKTKTYEEYMSFFWLCFPVMKWFYMNVRLHVAESYHFDVLRRVDIYVNM